MDSSIQRVATIYRSLLHAHKCLLHFFTAIAWHRLPTMDVPFRLVSWQSLASATSFWQQQLTTTEPHLFSDCKLESESHCDWRLLSLSVLVLSPVWGSWPDIHFDWKLQSCPYGALSLTRGRVCHLSDIVDSTSPCQYLQVYTYYLV
jgi:hypothetical protein